MSRGLPSPRVAALTIGITVIVVLLAPDPLRVPFAVAFVLLFPGYLATVALFPRNELGRVERTLLSLALSVSVVIVLGLLLNVTFGLRTASWAAALALVETALYAVARQRTAVAERRPAPPPRLRIQRRDVVALVVAVGLVSAAAALALTPLAARHVETYTALWIVPARDGKAVRIGVRSGEAKPLAYLLIVRNGDRRIRTRRFTVAPGSVATTLTTVPRRGGTLTANLFRLKRPQSPYRTVTIKVARRR